jgi:hypothetical protein
VHNNRERELYCEQESDLKSLNDWLIHDDKFELGGFERRDYTADVKT